MPLTFVHLSDIHFQKKSGNTYDLDKDLRDQLELDLSLMAKSIKKPIHSILVTGDIAFSGKEYDNAEKWLSELCQKIGCDEKHIWMVPGNHDVDRGVIQDIKDLQDIRSGLRSKTLSIQAKENKLRAILQDPIYAGIIFKPMDEYCRIAAQYGCGISPERPYWEKDFELGDNLKLRLRELTSTIISDKDYNDRENKLMLGQAQATLKQEDNVVYMTFCHHPPDWFMDKDETEHSLNLRARIQLFGHKHKQNFSYIDYNNTNKTLKLVAGAVHPDRDEMGWNPL